MKAEYSSAGGGVSLRGDKNKAGCTSKRWIIGIVTTLLLLGIIAIIVYFAVYHKQDIIPDPAPIVKLERTQVDCLVDHVTKTKAVCDERPMCSWNADSTEDGTKCTLNSYKDRGYMVQSVDTSNSPKVTKINLRWTGEKTSLYSKPGDIITNVTVEIHDLTNNMLRIKIVDTDDNSRYEVPVPLTIPAGVPEPLTNYNVIYSTEKGGKFSFKIERKSNSGNKVIFDTSMADIVMENQYLSLTAKAPTSNVYGFGENIHRSFRHQFQKSETWAMLARDQPPGQDPNQHQDNLYGVHNFYVCIEDGGEAHGVFLFNSNIQDVTLAPGNLITYRTIGGILDYYVFMGPSPENVIQQYTGLIGRPYMPPYWALGFQLCRYGYRNTSQIREAVERTRNASIPHDVQYADIDYMDGRKDFTIDPVNFGDLADYFRDLRQNHSMKTIIILDPALSIEANYPIYPEGKAADIYIKWPTDGSTAICDHCEDDDHNMFGYVWPDNKTAFPDFFRQSTWNKWREWIVDQSMEIDFDGLWIDMNEPAAFDTNKDKPWNWDTQRPGEADWNLKCDMSNPLENPPYKTKACHIYEGELRNISDKTLCMVGLQGDSREYTHYDVHNLYGWSQSEPTLKALREARTGKRGMVISRSTFAGSGKFAGHWLGDNTATWQHLRDSITGMLEFNMFGIPYVGADICGFLQDSNAELCMRWMQLGAFYPFSRNHNGIDWLDHDPASFSDEVAMRSREALEIRYELLPYLYTLFYQANKDGSTVVRSLQFQWPEDTNTYDINEQFLWGDGLLFSPVLYQGQTEVDMYVPKGMWYDYHSGAALGDISTGRREKIQISETTLPIHIRGGVILPLKTSALTTTESRKTNFRLYVALNEDEEADGLLFWDDGDSVDTTTEQCLISFEYKNKTLTSDVLNSGCKPDTTGDDSLKINNVRIMGLSGTVQSATVGGIQATVNQESTTKVTTVDNFTHDITRQLVMVLTFT